MSTIELRIGKLRRRKGRIRPSFDRLESRLALSGTGAGLSSGLSSGLVVPAIQVASGIGNNSPIAQADPAPSSVVASSPSALTITFNRPIDPFSIGNVDFALVHVAADGSTTPLSAGEAMLSEAADPADPTGTRIVLTLSRPLADGQYRLLLLGSNQLQTSDGLAVSPSGTDLEVSTFTVGIAGHGLAQAIDLGAASPDVVDVSDSLDLTSIPGDFKLYKLTLPAGHLWRLGLAVSAPNSGNPLLPVLSLFDAQGHLIDTSGQGSPGSPGDPFLFDGVSPGTYFVGVSGKGDIPGQLGGYDPARGLAGTSGIAQAGGGFQLQFVADPADKPTRVLGLRLDRADPNSTMPTGLTIQFSGPIRIADLLKSGQTSLTVVDASGQSWAVKPLHYDESQARLSVVFDQALPPGRYTLEAPAGSALVDLAGLVPVAPGRPSGVLGTFKVSPGKTAPDDLGAFLPGIGKAGLSAPVNVAAGTSIVEHFVVIQPGLYAIDGVGGSTGLSFSLRTADGSTVAMSPPRNGSPGVEGYLVAGTYTLNLGNPGNQAFVGSIKVLEKGFANDSLLLGGVSQGAALNLRLIAPTLSIDTSGSDSSAANDSPSGVYPQAPVGLSAGNGPAGATASATSRESGATSGAASGSILLFTTGPVGRPSSSGEQVSVVGPSGPSGSVALASNSEGLPRGIVGIPTRSFRGTQGETVRALETRPTEVPTAPATPRAEIDYGLISQDQAAGVDEQVLSSAGWIERIASVSLERLESLTGRVTPAAPKADGGGMEVPAEVDAEGLPEPLDAPRVEMASIAPSVGFGVLAMVAYRNRHRILLGLGPGRKPEPKRGHRTLFHGPHRPLRVHR